MTPWTWFFLVIAVFEAFAIALMTVAVRSAERRPVEPLSDEVVSEMARRYVEQGNRYAMDMDHVTNGGKS